MPAFGFRLKHVIITDDGADLASTFELLHITLQAELRDVNALYNCKTFCTSIRSC